MLVNLGRLVMTQGIANFVEENKLYGELNNLINKHANGDWGDLPKSDIQENNRALEEGGRLFSSYKLGGEKIYIITEWDRSYTTILFPDEY